MTTATPTKATAAAPSAAQQKAAEVEVAGINRREFLYYIWGASMLMLLGGTGAVTIWFALPRFKEGEFGGIIPFDPAALPRPGDAPVTVPEGRFHIANVPNAGLVALYQVCTHLGCLPKWETGQDRFACPCHGSIYELDGRWVGGPAPRGLDRFPMTIVLNDGTTRSSDSTGRPIPLVGFTQAEITAIRVDTGARINGPPHGTPPYTQS